MARVTTAAPHEPEASPISIPQKVVDNNKVGILARNCFTNTKITISTPYLVIHNS